MTDTARVALDWRRDRLFASGEVGYLDGTRVGGYTWVGGNGEDGPYALDLGRPPYLPTTKTPTRLRYQSAEDAKDAVERHVARALRRLVNAARQGGWAV